LPDAGAAGITPAAGRWALGISYRGTQYKGWQSQPGGETVQDVLEQALSTFADTRVSTVCAGRTDAGVHAINQVVHFDAPVRRDAFSWVRGTNRYLPSDIAVQWSRSVPADFHARFQARGRRYRYVLLGSPVRPSLETGLVGWVFDALELDPMQEAAKHLIGEHDFSSFRSSECQAATPVKTLRSITIEQRDAYWLFEFDASAYLHHMVRNIMGCLLAVGSGRRTTGWLAEVLAARDRDAAAPTFGAEGLYFCGPYYDAGLQLPERVPASGWLP
jgi:tRNA pseudouridine38-40 synthase